jgi:hypothetical protein
MDTPSFRYRAPLSRILFKDYQSFLLLLLTVASILFVVTLPLLLLFLPLLWWRVSSIKRTVEQGETVMGLIVSKRFSSGAWVVWYAFKAGENTYRVRNAIVALKLPIQANQGLRVAYDAQNPKRAFLPTLYGDLVDA